MRARLTHAAMDDLIEIHGHVLQQAGVLTAESVLAELEGAVARVAASPRSGHFRSDLADDDTRFVPVHSYLIAYVIGENEVIVIRVLHGARDVGAILRSRTQE